MNKKGITLVELIAVLAIIGLLAIIVVPGITKNIIDSKNKANKVQDSNIKEAAQSYLADHIGDDITFDESDTVTITLKVLVEEGYLTAHPSNPKTGEEYDLNASSVLVTKVNASYKYDLDLK